MKDARGHGSNGTGGIPPQAILTNPTPAPAAHQAGVEQLQPSLAEGRELYAMLSGAARAKSAALSGADPKGAIAGRYNGGWSRQDLQGMIGGTDQGGSYAGR